MNNESIDLGTRIAAGTAVWNFAESGSFFFLREKQKKEEQKQRRICYLLFSVCFPFLSCYFFLFFHFCFFSLSFLLFFWQTFFEFLCWFFSFFSLLFRVFFNFFFDRPNVWNIMERRSRSSSVEIFRFRLSIAKSCNWSFVWSTGLW